MAGPVEDQVGTSGKQPVWPDVAWFAECSLCKVEFSNTDGVAIPDLLAGEVAPYGAPALILAPSVLKLLPSWQSHSRIIASGRG